MSEREIEEAASIDAQACDFCPVVHINLIDDAGNIFASGGVPLEIVETFIARIRAAAAELATRNSAPARRQ